MNDTRVSYETPNEGTELNVEAREGVERVGGHGKDLGKMNDKKRP